jgi:PAS domain S-box-containing protein
MAGHPQKSIIKKAARRVLAQNGGERTLARDAGGRVLVEQALRESEQRFRATFEQAAVGIAHTTSAGEFLEVNEKLCAMLGYSRDELMRMTTLELSLSSEAGQHAALYQEVIDGKRERFSAEKRWQRKDGSVIWVNRTVSSASRTSSR